MNNVLLYVGCALTNAPIEFRDLVEDLKDRLNDWGLKVLEFLGLTAGTASDVVDTDLGNVAKCTHFIAIVDHPSMGLGIELDRAVIAKKPVLCLYKQGAKVTRMVIGFAEKGWAELDSYDSCENALRKIRAFVDRHPV